MLCSKSYKKQKIHHKKIIVSGNAFNWNVELENVLLKLNDKYTTCQQIALIFLVQLSKFGLKCIKDIEKKP